MKDQKLKLSINDFSVEIPDNGGHIDNIMPAILLLLELHGFHRNTIEGWIIEQADEYNKEGNE